MKLVPKVMFYRDIIQHIGKGRKPLVSWQVTPVDKAAAQSERRMLSLCASLTAVRHKAFVVLLSRRIHRFQNRLNVL